MRGKNARIAAVGLLVLAAVVAAVVLVLRPPPGTGEARETPDVAPVTVETHETPTGGRDRLRPRPDGAARILGSVVRGAEHMAAPGVTVRLIDALGDERSATTDEAGAFSFADVAPGGPYEVSVREAGSADVRVPGIALDRNEERDVGELVLAPAVPVDILVRTMGDVAIAGATVEAFAVESMTSGFNWQARMAQIGVAPVVLAASTTDADGRARFTGLASGTWTFRATKRGYATRGKNGVRLRSDRAADDITVHLPKGWTVNGTVHDGDGELLPNLLVMGIPQNMAWSPDHAPLNARTTTDAEGRFALGGLRSGPIGIWIGLPGGVPSLAVTVDVPRVQDIDIELVRGGVLTGVVSLEADNSPVAGVVVRASASRGNAATVAEAVTDAEGRYTIDTLMEGTVSQVLVEHPGHVVVVDGSPWKQIPLMHGETVTYDVELRRAAVVTGTVTGPDGPLGGAKLVLYTMGTAGNWGQKPATTEADGTYRVDGVDAGSLLVQARARGHFQRDFPQNWWQALQQKSAPEAWFAEVPKEGEVVKDLVLEKGTSVSGVVRDVDGNPVAGAEVRSWSGAEWTEVRSAEDGTYRLEGLPLGRDVTVYADADGHAPGTAKVELDGPKEGVDIALGAEHRLRGVVVADGPLDDAYVQLGAPTSAKPGRTMPVQQDQWSRIERLPVRADGTFDVPLPRWDPFVVRAVATGYAPTDLQAAKNDAGDTEAEIRLTPGGVIRGVVTSSDDGAPIANARIFAGPGQNLGGANMAWQLEQAEQRNPRPLMAVTDATGAYEITHLVAGGHNVTATAAGFVELLQHVVVKSEHELGFGLEPALAIAGVVRFDDGSPVGGARVTMRAASAMPYDPNTEVRTTADGRFRRDGLKSGTYSVNVEPPWSGDLNVVSTTVTGIAAGTGDLEIVAQRGLTITGRVVDAVGEGVASVSISGQPPQSAQSSASGFTPWRQARSDDTGAFELVGLHAGAWTISVGAQNGYASVNMTGIAAGSRDIVVRVTQGLAISGVLVDENGDSVGGKTLFAQLLDPPSGTNSAWMNATTDSTGKFTINGLTPGEYTIHMQGDSGSTVLSGGGRVAAGTTNVRLEYSKGLSISGRVVTSDGGSAQGAYVLALPGGQQNQGMKYGAVAADGTFAIDGLQPGVSYTLRSMGGNYRQAEVADVQPGATDLTLALEPGLSVSGTLVDADGQALAQAMLQFTALGGTSSNSGSTAGDGTFTIGGLDQGRYKVVGWIRTGDENGSMKQVELGEVDAGRTGVEFRAPRE